VNDDDDEIFPRGRGYHSFLGVAGNNNSERERGLDLEGGAILENFECDMSEINSFVCDNNSDFGDKACEYSGVDTLCHMMRVENCNKLKLGDYTNRDCPYEFFTCGMGKCDVRKGHINFEKHPELGDISTEGIVDSGATAHLSSNRSLFSWLSKDPTVEIYGISGKISMKGYWGMFRENSLELTRGVYHPNCPELLLSCGVFLDEGHHVFMKSRADSKIIINKAQQQGGFVYPIVWKRLPLVLVSFAASAFGGGLISDSAPSDESAMLSKTLFTDREMVRNEPLLLHRRLGHLHVAGLDPGVCDECCLAKGGKTASGTTRQDRFKPQKPFEQCDADFWGPVSVASIRRKRWVLVVICAKIAFVKVFPLIHKDEAPEVVAHWIDRIRAEEGVSLEDLVFHRFRTDNAPEFRGEFSKWVTMLIRNHIKPDYSIPYTPSMNGVVERFMRTLGENLKAMLVSVDQRLWCFAAEYLSLIWNILPKKRFKGLSPMDLRRSSNKADDRGSYNVSRLRRFGCLCYVLDNRALSKLAPKYLRGVFLGVSDRNSGYLVGVWRRNLRCSAGEKFETIESRDVKFVESVMVRNIDDLQLKNKGAFVMFDPLGPGVWSSEGSAPVAAPKSDDGECAPRMFRPGQNVSNSGENPTPSQTLERNTFQQPHGQIDSSTVNKKELLSSLLDPQMPIMPNPENIVENNGVRKKMRGRPKGSKDKHQRTRKKVGKYKKRSRMQAYSYNINNSSSSRSHQGISFSRNEDHVLNSIGQADEVAVANLIQTVKNEVEDAGELDKIDCFVTYSEAFNGPDAVHWMEADNKEKLTLEAMECWRPITDLDRPDIKEVVPSAVIYTRKRCGKYKARLVALGNRQAADSVGEIYSPTVSHVANRALLVHAAANAHHVTGFDLTAAFINASMEDEQVFMRLPKQWSVDKLKGDIVKLLKCIYGLKQAPRRWFDTYAKYLRTRGWSSCPMEPGLWRKGEMLLSVYVDDSLICGPNKDDVWAEQDDILGKFKGNVIKPVHQLDGANVVWEVRDVLGATLKYCRSKRRMKVIMDAYIDKMLKKWNMEDCRIYATPCEPCDLSQGKEVEFPIKSLSGGLQWIATICRPDIQFAVQRVQRVTKVTSAVVKAAKRILAYLKGTKNRGLEYSPQIEEQFRKQYQNILKNSRPTSSLPNTVVFSDSDFAGCCQTLRSTSGSIMYFRGCPLAWRCKRQTIRAHSTTEAEYVAAHDSLVLREEQGYLSWMLEEEQLPFVMFVDNMSTIKVSQQVIPTKKSKHFALRYMKVKEHCDQLAHVPTGDNKSDPLTKPLPSDAYSKMLANISIMYFDDLDSESDFAA